MQSMAHELGREGIQICDGIGVSMKSCIEDERNHFLGFSLIR
jgi:hypothetical protein